MKNRNVVRATIVYLLFYTMLATEHVFEHSYAASILGFDETNLIDLNWYVFAGIIAGVVFTYLTFALRKWRYKTMTIIGFSLAASYLAWFYFGIGAHHQRIYRSCGRCGSWTGLSGRMVQPCPHAQHQRHRYDSS